jgi:hypothetical protein
MPKIQPCKRDIVLELVLLKPRIHDEIAAAQLDEAPERSDAFPSHSLEFGGEGIEDYVHAGAVGGAHDSSFERGVSAVKDLVFLDPELANQEGLLFGRADCS